MSIEKIFSDLTVAINDLTKTLQVLSPKVHENKGQDEEVQPKPTKVKKVAAVVEEEEIEEDQEEVKPVKKVKKVKQSETSNDSEGKSNITSDEVIKLAKLKIAEGHERGFIKNKIEQLGSDSIDGLTQSKRNEFYDWLMELAISDNL